MRKSLFIISLISVFCMPTIVSASDRDDDMSRTQNATRVFQEIMSTPDKGIPNEILESAKCIAIIPGDKKFAFIFGGNYGRGVATCHTAHGWSAPMFVALMVAAWDTRSVARRPTW